MRIHITKKEPLAASAKRMSKKRR